MTLQRTNQAAPKQPERRSLSRSSRSMGIYVLAGRGTGKSRLLGRKIAMQDYLAGFPQVVFDPVGATIDNFLDKVTRFLQENPTSLHSRFWDRIVYVDMSGKDGVVVPFPLYYKLGTERSLLEIAERFLQTIIKSNPDLFHAQVLGWPPLHRIGVNSGLVLAALGYQITEAEDLLDNPEAWEASGRFAKAEQVLPEAKRAVAYFRNKYVPMREQDRSRVTTPFLDKIFTFPLDPTLRAMFGASEPGIKWDNVGHKGQTVLLDFRREQDEEMRRFNMLRAFDYLYSWIKTRGRQDEKPFGLIIDEFAHMTQQVVSGTNPLARELDEFINTYMRQHTIWFTAAHQELYQIDEQLRNTMLSLGTYILGGTSSMAAARDLADALFLRDPYWVKYWRPVSDPLPRGVINRPEGYEQPKEPEFMALEEQTELFAQRIKQRGTMCKAGERIIIALAEFDYLTPAQITQLLYAPSSLTHVYEQMKSLVAEGYVLTLGGRAVNLPLIYSLSGKGRHHASLLGATKGKRFRPSEEADKGHNPYFLKHTIAVTDVLIAARLLSERVPAIRLPRMYTERELRRKIYIPLAGKSVCLEPDASLLFRITESWHNPPETWEDFFHIEVYRNLPPAEWRFKQKIQGYIATVDTGRHEALFHTPALSIAVIAQTEQIATTLKRWTEEALTEIGRLEEGDWFFFCSLDTATASPEELYLSPVWEQPFSTVKTPLLILE